MDSLSAPRFFALLLLLSLLSACGPSGQQIVIRMAVTNIEGLEKLQIQYDGKAERAGGFPSRLGTSPRR